MMELRLRMLKECLLEDSNSCSSNGFISIPRRLPLDPFPKKKQSNALKAVINAVKNLRSNSAKSSPLQRSFSLSKKKIENKASITVIRVKDIVRWSSSKDLHEDVSHSELSPPHQYYTIKTTTTNTGSSSTSWSDSDVTSEFLPSSRGSNGEECGGKNSLGCVGEDSCTAVTDADTEEGPEDLERKKEQNSPVSVFEIRHEEDDESSDSSFSHCLVNVERTKEKLMETIQRFESLANISPFNLDEWDSMDGESCREGGGETDIRNDDKEIEDEESDEVEEKALQLWNQAKERHCTWIHEEQVIMDYFRDELRRRTSSFHRDQHFEDKLVREAKGWLHEQREVAEPERGTSEERRHACAREIERRDWNEKRMQEELEEVVVQIEDGLFNLLMNETLTTL